MRKAAGYLAVVFSIALLSLATAGANQASADPPGNNGTVKIHEGATENEPLRANEPHVCTFHIHGFNFDANARGTWRIEGWAPTGGGTYTGTWGAADGNGDWRSPGAMSIPPGHYKLFVWQTMPNDPPGGAKQKVFWVECGDSGNSNGASNGSSNGNSNGNSNGASSGASTGFRRSQHWRYDELSQLASRPGHHERSTGVSALQSRCAKRAERCVGVESLRPRAPMRPSSGRTRLAMMGLGIALLSRRPATITT